MIRRFTIIAALLALVAVACGSGDAVGGDQAAPTTVANDDALPPNPAAGACLEGAEDCNDIPGQEPGNPLLEGDEPDLSQEPGVSGGFVVGGGLTVSEALETDADGIVAVQGFIVADDTGTRLCEGLAESLPPLCSGASIEVSDLSTVDPDELNTEQGVTWTDVTVTLLGELVDGTLVVDPGSI
ncbi:MAG: hypothetical protein R3290_02170 [Acidimicrobiia bacterium]|nr:hypothetical protein [Acidimicrobiia bacterium]